MEVLKDDQASHKGMAIVERFGVFVDYTYPVAINIRRTRHVVREVRALRPDCPAPTLSGRMDGPRPLGQFTQSA